MSYLKKTCCAKIASVVFFLFVCLSVNRVKGLTTICKHCSFLEPPQKSSHERLCCEPGLYLQKLINYVRIKSDSFSTVEASWLMWGGHIAYEIMNKYTSYVCEHMNTGSYERTSCCSKLKNALVSSIAVFV